MAWLSGWNKRVKITVSNTNVDAALSNFPVLVYLSVSSGTGSADVSCIFDELTSDANRFKIAVTTSDGETECYVEIERWDDANEKAWLWVKVPSVSASAVTELYIYYDSSHADNTAKVGDIDSTPGHNVWDSNFKLSSHMRDATTPIIKDSTSNGNDGTKKAANEPIEATGKVDMAQDFDGVDDYIEAPNSASLNITDAITIEVCVKRDVTDVQQTIAQHWYGTSKTEEQWFLDFRGAGSNKIHGYLWDIAPREFTGNTDIDTNWHYIAMTWNGSYINVYLDEQSDMTPVALSTTLQSSLVETIIGAYIFSNDYHFKGLMDEIRVSNTNRSVAWLKATYYSLWDNIASYGTEEISSMLSEAFSMGDVVEVTWSAQGVIAEAFSFDDYVSLPIDAIIEEAFSSNDSVLGGKVFSITIEETFNSDDVILVNWNAQGIIAEALSLNDDLSINWNVICDVMEEISLDDYFWASASNVYGRFRKPVNLAGNRISLKIQNNSVDQILWLQDLGLLLFGREEYFENNKPTNLQSQHIQLKIQHNTLSETLHLFDIGLRLTGYDQR